MMMLTSVGWTFRFRLGLVRQTTNLLNGKAAVNSTGKTSVMSRFYAHQESLPHLPVPSLQQTLDKYLKTVRPLVNDYDYENTKNLVETFGKKGGYGEHLQQQLLDHAKRKENWLSEWWLDCAYLESRASVVIYCSPAVSFPKLKFHGSQGQIEQAAKVIAGFLEYKIDIDNETIPVEKLGKHPLCMDQYYRILSACRIPGVAKDEVHCHAKSWIPPRHITVIHNSQFFELNVYHDDKTPLTISELETQLSRIVASSEHQSSPPLGILTSSNRDSWGKAYNSLAVDQENQTSFKSIQRSIFAVCLDKETPPVPESEWRNDLASRLLHGGGSNWNSCNRWFDKTLQVIVDRNGGVGIAYEHSPAEGPPIAAMLDFVYAFCENIPKQPESSIISLPLPKQLHFNVPDKIDSDIKKASKEINELIAQLDLTVIDFVDYGKDFIKSMKLSPDSYIQIAMQLAYYSVHNQAPASYESASLRRFRLGRTDTIRSCSIASDNFTKAYVNKRSIAELADLLKKAVIDHKQYTNEAIAGHAIDRHLLGLRLIAKKSGQEEPLIFKDDTYKHAMSFNLSTSQVSAKADLSMVFGPAVNNGYGICYNPKSDHILFSVCSWKDLPEYNVKAFHKHLFKALGDMKEILMSGASKL